MKRRQPEAELQKAVVRLIRLAFPHVLVFAVPNGGKRSKVEAAIFKAMGVLPGVADLLVFWRGGCGAIELKVGKNDQTDYQRDFMYRWTGLGHKYGLCTSLDEVEHKLREWTYER